MTTSENHTGKREAILAAAERVFGQSGYAAATVDAVAAEAGVAKGSVYNYFKSKEALFHEVFLATVEVAEAELARITDAPGTAAEKIGRGLEFWHERLERFLGIGRMVIEAWSVAAGENSQGQLTSALRRGYDGPTRFLEEIIRQGVASGEFRSDIEPPVAANLIDALLDGVMLQVILGVRPRVDAVALGQMRNAILAALRGPAPQSIRETVRSEEGV